MVLHDDTQDDGSHRDDNRGVLRGDHSGPRGHGARGHGAHAHDSGRRRAPRIRDNLIKIKNINIDCSNPN